VRRPPHRRGKSDSRYSRSSASKSSPSSGESSDSELPDLETPDSGSAIGSTCVASSPRPQPETEIVRVSNRLRENAVAVEDDVHRDEITCGGTEDEHLAGVGVVSGVVDAGNERLDRQAGSLELRERVAAGRVGEQVQRAVRLAVVRPGRDRADRFSVGLDLFPGLDGRLEHPLDVVGEPESALADDLDVDEPGRSVGPRERRLDDEPGLQRGHPLGEAAFALVVGVMFVRLVFVPLCGRVQRVELGLRVGIGGIEGTVGELHEDELVGRVGRRVVSGRAVSVDVRSRTAVVHAEPAARRRIHTDRSVGGRISRSEPAPETRGVPADAPADPCRYGAGSPIER